MIYHVILYIFTTLSKQKNWPNWPSILDVMKTHHHTTRCQQRTPNAIHFPQVQRGGKATNRNIERNTSENVRTAAVHENRWSRIAKWWIAERRFPISQAISPNLPKSNSKKCWWHAQGTTYAWGWFNWHNLTTFMYKNVKRTFPNRSIVNIRIYDHAYILSYYIYNIIYDELWRVVPWLYRKLATYFWTLLTSIVYTTGATIKHSIHGSSNTQADWLKHLRFVVRLLRPAKIYLAAWAWLCTYSK